MSLRIPCADRFQNGDVVQATTSELRDVTPRDKARDRMTGIALFIAILIVYNANGREIGSYDSQSTKLAARELLLRGTLAVNHVVGVTPAYAGRWGFIHAADGNYRSIYSPMPAVLAAAMTWPLWKLRIIDIRAPLAPSLMAKLAASLLTAIAVTLAFFSARQRLSRRRALLLVTGLGLGTGFWSTAGQTLWQTETAVFGLAIAVYAFAAPVDEIGSGGATAIGLGLGLAAATRPQLAPIIGLVLVGTWLRTSLARFAAAGAIVALFVGVLGVENLRWFGHPLGALPLLQKQNAVVHASGASFRLSWEGFAGLLVSPSRGLLIFSPVVLVAAAGVRTAFREGRASPLRWCTFAIAAQYALYASYSVWWGGHTYGPRYMLDVLPLGVPLAAAAMRTPRPTRIARAGAIILLTWSVVVAATGAFCYPNDVWNADPTDIDRDHSRLWSWSDTQIARCWKRGLSPQNFALIDQGSVRVAGR